MYVLMVKGGWEVGHHQKFEHRY